MEYKELILEKISVTKIKFISVTNVTIKLILVTHYGNGLDSHKSMYSRFMLPMLPKYYL